MHEPRRIARPGGMRPNTVPKRRQIILLHAPEDVDASAGQAAPALGTLAEVLALMRPFGIAPDGSGDLGLGEALGMAVLHGPGMTVEVPTTGGRSAEITQAMVTLTDEDFAFPVLMRLCKARALRMFDPDSGRSFG